MMLLHQAFPDNYWLGATAATWASENPTPVPNTRLYETDTRRFKFADGVTAYNDLPYASPGLVDLTGIADGDALVWNAAQSLWLPAAVGNSGGVAGTNLKSIAQFYDEFTGPNVTNNGWTTDISGGTLLAQVTSQADMTGVVSLASGSASGNRAGMIQNGVNVDPGAGEIRGFFRMKGQHVPGVTQQHSYQLGLCDLNTTTSNNLIFIGASDSGIFWRLYWTCSATGTSGNSIATVPIVASQTEEFDIVLAPNGLSVGFYSGNALIETVTLPAVFPTLHPYFRSRKSSATGASSILWVDKILVEQNR